jgi:hypothetical protein
VHVVALPLLVTAVLELCKMLARAAMFKVPAVRAFSAAAAAQVGGERVQAGGAQQGARGAGGLG